ncbi:phospho-sugar mutase [Caldisalinibacter kiritimatiensis]|uniref:Phosphoglucomutase n=1 Tax=Caldisalinibacter kiritimatiensis TaxID=1304284 RepID=R1CAE7_9FIRM|nr:phospho-sugar mutase [Caldisalinibacter kiritimatiensis]EOC99299.1 Phosphomannomutase [Caldisalinibacter kiritimatiensis]
MSYMDKYELWLNSEYFDDETKEELASIKNNEKEIEDRFYKDLEFGTGGLRGKIGAGTNRINKYTVARATQGLANYIIQKGNENVKKGVAIAHDSRYKSREFAKTAALVLAANGIKSYLFEDLRPTPELSFSIRHLGATAGIVVTASHNPPEYNGYKVYWEDGGQIVPSIANEIIGKIKEINNFSTIEIMDENEALEKGLLNIIGKEIDDIYIDKVKELSVRENVDKDIKIVYTPLHGTGNMPVRRVLKELGYNNVYVVKEQEKPDPQFSTVDYPNPEDPNAFKLAMEMGQNLDADILLGTDPDCDRVGVVVKNLEGKYIVLNGNQTGALLLDYILQGKKEKNEINENDVVIKTIVTSDLGRVIAKYYGLETIDTLTGFKFIGEKIKEFEENKDKSFVFGYEESFGYLTGTFVRDKDAVIASMLVCEMAAYYKTKGMTLYEALQQLYKKYGYYIEELKSIKLEGIEGQRKIDAIMDSFRSDFPTEIGKLKLNTYNDYREGKSVDVNTNEHQDITLPKSNVLKFIFNDNSWYALRPSGTEPKIKIYMSANGKTEEEARQKLEDIKKEVLGKVDEIATN